MVCSKREFYLQPLHQIYHTWIVRSNHPAGKKKRPPQNLLMFLVFLARFPRWPEIWRIHFTYSLHRADIARFHFFDVRVVEMPGFHHSDNWHTVDGWNPAPVEVGSLSQYLRGFIHPRWLAGFQPSTVALNNPRWCPIGMTWLPPSVSIKSTGTKSCCTSFAFGSLRNDDMIAGLKDLHQHQSIRIETIGKPTPYSMYQKLMREWHSRRQRLLLEFSSCNWVIGSNPVEEERSQIRLYTSTTIGILRWEKNWNHNLACLCPKPSKHSTSTT